MYRGKEFAGLNNFVIENFMHLSDEEILSDFVRKYYEDINNIAKEIYISYDLTDRTLLSELLSKAKGKKTEIKVPKKSKNRQIMEMAVKNAGLYGKKKKFEKDLNFSRLTKDMIRLKEILGLRNIPRRVECYDISNLKDSFAVGSMVVLKDGEPSNKDYRQFRIRTLRGQNDYGMIAELLIRRLRHLKKSDIDIGDTFHIRPDLIIVDGGLGQLNIANDVLAKTGYNHLVDLISIAKKEERLFSIEHPEGLSLSRDESALRIIIKARDEAHRFAINYHKKIRDKDMTKSVLDGIKGIGKKKTAYIFEKYRSLDELRGVSVQQLAEIKGITYKDAQNIFNAINR
jgi:excinuclease ABC subunit C